MPKGILNGLLPVLPKINVVHPIDLKTKEEIQQELNTQATLERLAKKTVNHDPNTLYLEHIEPSLFQVFSEQKNNVIQTEKDDFLKLLPVGSLSVRQYVEGSTIPVTTLNINEYKEQRRLNQMQLVLSTNGHDTSMIDDEYFPNTQDVNNMLESLLGPDNTIESIHQPLSEPMLIDHPDNDIQMTNNRQLVETNSNTTISRPVDTQPVTTTEEQEKTHVPDTTTIEQSVETNNQRDDREIIINSSDSETETDTRMVEVEPIETAPLPTILERERPTVEPISSNSSEISVSSPPTIITASAPKRAVQPASPPPQQQTDSLSNEWYNDDLITLNTEETNLSKIYGYKPKMIPIFATKEQERLCDEVNEICNLTKNNAIFNINIEKMVDILNFPSSNLDMILEDQWNQSGKTMFIKQLLEGLLGNDLILLIVAKDLNEEEILIELIEESLSFDCIRVNYCLDNVWDEEYGILVKTNSKLNRQKSTAERGGDFSAVADFIICMDFRISENNPLFKKISKRGTADKNIPPPAAWLITIGSVEERTFLYLNENHIAYNTKKSEDLKKVMVTENDWPINSSSNVKEFNHIVADNVKSWLTQITDQYQYRSLKNLPKSYLYGHLKHIPGIIEENATSDMDIASDTDYTQSPPPPPTSPLLSDIVLSYVDKVIVPPFNITQGELIETDSNEIFNVLPEQEKDIIKSLQEEASSEYRNDVKNLKRQYETAFQELQQKHRNQFISKLENIKRSS